MTFARSYVKTRDLEELALRDPAMAEQIERLCRAVMALRGPAMMLEASSSLSYAASALAPFVVMQDAFGAAMVMKADVKQASEAGRKSRKQRGTA